MCNLFCVTQAKIQPEGASIEQTSRDLGRTAGDHKH